MQGMLLNSPIGWLAVMTRAEGICGLYFRDSLPEGCMQTDAPLLTCAREQLLRYFEGKLTAFDLPLSIRGTAFQKKVWQALCSIPYGETRTYAQVAALVGSPKAYRAVGLANNRNRISIIIPCHRVVGADGGLVGYGGGLHRKRALLDLEHRWGYQQANWLSNGQPGSVLAKRR